MASLPSSMRQILIETIVREIAPDAIILFGSQARGQAQAGSDVDLLIIDPEPFTPKHSRRQQTARLYLALRKLNIAKDLLLYSRDEYERLRHCPQHIVSRAEREGEVIYGRH